MRGTMVALGWLGVVAGCDGKDEPACLPAERVPVFVDADGDGFGADAAGTACAAGPGESEEDGDCADDDPEVHPEARERCNGLDDDCDDALDDGLHGRIFLRDADGDGFGDHDDAVTACAAPPGRVLDDTDCDDGAETVNPGAPEVCNGGVDDDCDGVADDEDDSLDPTSTTPFYRDGDGDGYGDPDQSRAACLAPDGAVADGTDCDDARDDVNPAAVEVCNLRDDDCDTLLDHLDDSIDPSVLLPGFADADADGFGDPATPIQTCGYRRGIATEAGDDCDDADAAVSPGDPERTCNGLDDDCDPATGDDPDRDGDGFSTCGAGGDCDDRDPTVHPGATEIVADGRDADCDGQESCYHDADGDGLRDDLATPSGPDPACTTPPNRPPEAPIDCDDTDPAIDWTGDWTTDADGDGFGDGVVVLSGVCADPGAGLAPALRPTDCDDADPGAFPGAREQCNDGVDANCDGTDACRTCAEWLASDAAAPTGVYDLLAGGQVERVYCDMTEDGGGWTLVAASVGVGVGIDNYGVPTATGLDRPGQRFTTTGGVWDGLRPAVPATHDVRFTCTTQAGGAAAVDLSFYDVDWYDEITRPFGQSCFQVPGAGVTPARRDNLTGDERASTDAYLSGALVGEAACGVFGDFTVDFEDAGKDSDESDGTDWGNDDYVSKCGVAGAGYAWYVFVR